jgi:hypothetical protein
MLAGVSVLVGDLQGFVYLIRHRGCGKEYVGITVRKPETRWTEHLKAAAAGSVYLLHAALAKDGAANFAFSVVWTGAVRELHAQEQLHIVRRNCKMPYGYNMTAGGERFAARLPQSRAMLRLGVENILKDPIVVPADVHPRTGGSFCCLSLSEATRLVDWSVRPTCKSHRHLKRHIVERGGYKVLDAFDGSPTAFCIQHTELAGWVRWDWDTKFMGA